MALTVLRTSELLTPIAHFSHAVRYADTVLVGGKGATDPRATVSSGGQGINAAAAQAERMFQNVGTVLRLLEADFADALQMKVYLTDWRFKPAFEAACQQVYGSDGPATAAVQSISFAIPDLLLEIDLIVADGGHSRQAIYQTDGRRVGVRLGDVFYSDGLSGDLESASGEVNHAAAQSETALGALLGVLECAGLRPEQVARVTATVADPRDVAAFADAWRRLLSPPRPPCVIVCAGLPDPRAYVQVEAVADASGVDRVTFADVGARSPELEGESIAARAGQFVFTAGLPYGTYGALPYSRDAEAATDRALDGMFLALERFGCDPSDLLRVDAAVPDWRYYRSFNVAYSQRIAAPYPARSAVEALPAGLHQPIQLGAIAGLQAHSKACILAPPEYAQPIPREDPNHV